MNIIYAMPTCGKTSLIKRILSEGTHLWWIDTDSLWMSAPYAVPAKDRLSYSVAILASMAPFVDPRRLVVVTSFPDLPGATGWPWRDMTHYLGRFVPASAADLLVRARMRGTAFDMTMTLEMAESWMSNPALEDATSLAPIGDAGCWISDVPSLLAAISEAEQQVKELDRYALVRSLPQGAGVRHPRFGPDQKP